MNIEWIKMYFLSVFAHFVLVPIGYLKIVLFLRIQNKKIGGKNKLIKQVILRLIQL